MSPVAALDCGTNSTRLLVLDDDGRTLDREMRITRLGQGVDATGQLREDAIGRTLDALRAYREVMDRRGVTRGRLAATSAARDAQNGRAFLDAAANVTGVRAELLSGEEEGQLSFDGATYDLDAPGTDDVIVLDIGGGSTELVVRDERGVHAHSMQVGCVRVTERSLLDDPPTPEGLAAARELVDRALDGAFEALPQLASEHPFVVGLAGTVSTLAMLDLGLAEYDEAALHRHWMSLATIGRWRRDLAAETVAERRARVGMVPGREDVLVAGLVILERTIERLGADGCLHSEHDILDGLARSVLRAA